MSILGVHGRRLQHTSISTCASAAAHTSSAVSRSRVGLRGGCQAASAPSTWSSQRCSCCAPCGTTATHPPSAEQSMQHLQRHCIRLLPEHAGVCDILDQYWQQQLTRAGSTCCARRSRSLPSRAIIWARSRNCLICARRASAQSRTSPTAASLCSTQSAMCVQQTKPVKLLSAANICCTRYVLRMQREVLSGAWAWQWPQAQAGVTSKL